VLRALTRVVRAMRTSVRARSGGWRGCDRLPRVHRWLAAVLTLLAVASEGVAAQSLQLRVIDSVSRLPMRGVLVNATSVETGVSLDRLTTDDGRLTVRLPSSGRWILSLRRLGHAPRRNIAIRIDSAATSLTSLAMLTGSFSLPAVTVKSMRGSCRRDPRADDRTSALWEQITLALRSADLQRDSPITATSLRVVVTERELDRALREKSSRELEQRIGLGRPFHAADPDRLAEYGYVQQDPDGLVSYFAPDERVFLSQSFLRTHCFETPRADSIPGIAELKFRPATDQSTPDVAGTAYVDALSGALHRITFRYVNVGDLSIREATGAGGEVVLRQLHDESWIVSAWSIRMPKIVSLSWGAAPVLGGYVEVGGTAELLGDPRGYVSTTNEATASVDPMIRSADSLTSAAAVLERNGITARIVEARSGFLARRRSNVGEFLDSTDIARAATGSALGLLKRFGGVSVFRVPPDVPPPTEDANMELAREWRADAELPVIAVDADASPSGGLCLIRLYLDAIQVRVADIGKIRALDVAALELYRRPRDVPDPFRRRGDICATAIFWTYVNLARLPGN